MSECRKDLDTGVSRYLLIFILAACLIISPKAFAQPDTARREHPQPPPHPKPPSLKEVVNKINIFKKHKDEPAPATATEPVKQPAPVPPPPPVVQPDPVKPVKHTTTKKKTKKATGTKKPAAPKPTQPLI